ncbi:sirohydrochlorin chelatase [Kitasatospora cathayae]|uniref:Cobalamin biosynthesis protein CbiX n=1 Tax=Kitasatospora cathayae TaxID=3004092 RepID=A0ABY7Q044_9ACTN|nr:cobalamin biosynthesis protein CbiX [Kitasatospora sp. HUAS 3-15]WBP86058.1 cobalamin biosynthesis protein CbiX [Kitasatospora sp. HUAS 3-15]
MTAPQPAVVVLAGGHESGGGRDLAALVQGEPAGHAPVVLAAAAAGRPLAEAVRSALAAGDAPVCVVPMTLGRDPKLVADTARALRWLATGEGRGRLALTAPFGAAEHLIGWLRAAAASAGNGDAVLVTAPAAGPFEDAELFRIARLVRQYGRHRLVEVALAGGDPSPAEGAERCRLLGAERITAVPASFGPALPAGPLEGVRDGGPLLRPSAIGGVIAARTAAALHLLGHGEDGIRAGLDAEHGHGYAHSHGPGENHHHSHSSNHPHTHTPH